MPWVLIFLHIFKEECYAFTCTLTLQQQLILAGWLGGQGWSGKSTTLRLQPLLMPFFWRLPFAPRGHS